MNFSKTIPNRRSFLKASAALGASTMLSSTNIEASKQVVTTAAAQLAPASGVKVKDVRTYKLKNAIFVQVIADNGMSGWGEASPNNRHLVETFIHTGLKVHVIGRNVWDAEPMWDDMFFGNHDLGPDGVLPYSIAGIDCALWDLKGKLVGLPVYK
ncbi:MAG: twin-arginine translocation signal domain-containing protein, partial [Acidobacteriota bacterium]|nr:twin-arginine translocation signal domain-containing protein [Acidobacteriota bacterium]